MGAPTVPVAYIHVDSLKSGAIRRIWVSFPCPSCGGNVRTRGGCRRCVAQP